MRIEQCKCGSAYLPEHERHGMCVACWEKQIRATEEKGMATIAELAEQCLFAASEPQRTAAKITLHYKINTGRATREEVVTELERMLAKARQHQAAGHQLLKAADLR